MWSVVATLVVLLMTLVSCIGLVLPLQKSQLSPPRALLRKSRLPLGGSVKDFGYYYTTLLIGQPSKPFDLIMDTGSSMTYVPCDSCEHCGTHEDEPFDPTESKTASYVQCEDEECKCGGLCGCYSPNYISGYGNVTGKINTGEQWDGKCQYQRSYAEDSSSVGVLVSDVVQIGTHSDENPPVFTFGCALLETGELRNQQADGILGLGNSIDAFHEQLKQQGVFPSASFAYCLGGQEGEGVLLLGESPVPLNPNNKTLVSPPSALDPFYKIDLIEIKVQGASLGLGADFLQGEQGAILDSGTTFTYLPRLPFLKFVQRLDDYLSVYSQNIQKSMEQGYNCYRIQNSDEMIDINKYFPVVEFEFGDGGVLVSLAEQYMFNMTDNLYCLGIIEGEDGTILGGISFRNILVHHDMEKLAVSFTSVECDQYNPCSAKNQNQSDPLTQSYCELHKIQNMEQEKDVWNYEFMLGIIGGTLVVIFLALMIVFMNKNGVGRRKLFSYQRQKDVDMEAEQVELQDTQRRQTVVQQQRFI
eukprot:TRINITY_DN1487_c0_g1_i1.p1 TRINITY_DN1487_c0_g1~~TRINITY_DN1487_c0_g1_i1.p1  ORF type:complete len:570 (+),score=63.78 TRINITY_DN1487_c0_g1_i1:124-1710(+)